MERKIIHKESTSVGKYSGHNDDSLFIGEDYVAVIDGVSHKSSILYNGQEIKIADIITEAIRRLDGTNFAEGLEFGDFVKYINRYIERYLTKIGRPEEIGKLEATGVVYSRHLNQIWLVGDCRAIYDGTAITNPLKIDDVVIDIRIKIIEALLKEGYTRRELEKCDISKQIIQNPDSIKDFIKSKKLIEKVQQYRDQRIRQALLECGFTEEEIKEEDLIHKYANPRDLQEYLKNNPCANEYGYAIFNGRYTETKNCKVVQLPDNVKIIKLFSDGFSVDALSSDKDVGQALIHMWEKAKKDPLSIKCNRATHPAKKYNRRIPVERAIDDRTAVIIEIRRDDKRRDERRKIERSLEDNDLDER